MLVNMKEMLTKAMEGKYAVPHFNINNLEWTKFILEEAENQKSPVILGVSEGASKYMGGYRAITGMVTGLLEDLKITIPVALHLDHGGSFEACREAIDAGFTSVMIDASRYSLEENIAITKQVVDYAHPKNVTVEAEIGHIGGTEDEITADIGYAKVEDCMALISAANIDFLAPALGSVHGLYKGKPKLDFVRMEEIHRQSHLPLVLHGGTGIYDEQIREAIRCGITKVNINTELQIAWSEGVREFLAQDTKVYDPRKIIKSGETKMKQAIANKIELLGSKGIATHN